jgi:hypothetical protein
MQDLAIYGKVIAIPKGILQMQSADFFAIAMCCSCNRRIDWKPKLYCTSLLKEVVLNYIHSKLRTKHNITDAHSLPTLFTFFLFCCFIIFCCEDKNIFRVVHWPMWSISSFPTLGPPHHPKEGGLMWWRTWMSWSSHGFESVFIPAPATFVPRWVATLDGAES